MGGLRNGSEAENRPIPEHTIGFCRDKKRSDEPADISIRFTGATTTGSCGGPRAVPHVGNALAATTGRLLLLL